ncbi:MAG: SRPBCC family protein [Bacteroidales bacterium]|nr:SRPBCC family protein [Bacteroidales bacterium]
MKALKVILIIVGLLVAAILIVPLFAPATAKVSVETTIALEPSEIFPTVASFMDRHKWDPWYTQDSTADVRIGPKPDYVGSTYSWKGEKVGTGRMEVISVKENEYIESNLWFGNVETPSLVEWSFEPVDGGTRVVWSFSQETTYPIGRLAMMFGKVFLRQSFELGLANLKEYLESMPRSVSKLGPIAIEAQNSIMALVTDGAGTMETIGVELGRLYGLLYAEVERQQLEVSGPAFVHYLDYDESTGHSNYRAGFIVNKAGVDAGEVVAVEYPEMKVVQAMHTGPYEEFTLSYGKMDSYIRDNGLEVTGEAFEFYVTGMMTESDNTKWETLIAFPLK